MTNLEKILRDSGYSPVQIKAEKAAILKSVADDLPGLEPDINSVSPKRDEKKSE
jgi:hypothetical protein